MARLSVSLQSRFFSQRYSVRARSRHPTCLHGASYFLKVKSLSVAKTNKVYLRDLAVQPVHEIVRRCFVEVLRPSIAPHISELIHAHRAEGRTVILMSGSLSILVRPFHEHFETDLMVAHELEVIDGRFTGQRSSFAPLRQKQGETCRTTRSGARFRSQSFLCVWQPPYRRT